MTVALVTGGNRGLGYEVCRQLGHLGWRVVLGARDATAGSEAAATLAGEGLDVVFRQLDVTDAASVQAAAAGLDALDVLVNNAGILWDHWQTAIDCDLQLVRQAFETNTIGALTVVRAFYSLLRQSPHPRIVNVSSNAAGETGMGPGAPAYRLSKSGLNGLTRMLAAELEAEKVLVNAVSPGWVATDMGGPEGGPIRPVAEGAPSIVWAATLPDDGPTGGFFVHGVQIPW